MCRAPPSAARQLPTRCSGILVSIWLASELSGVPAATGGDVQPMPGPQLPFADLQAVLHHVTGVEAVVRGGFRAAGD
jgi:hypothetical protein